ncbi:MAG TPA: ABC transporter substrate-binding protein [Geminicoccaceae bacterium]
MRSYASAAALSVLAAALLAAPAGAQDRAVTIVLPEGLDIVDPCHVSRSNIGRVLKQNVVETLTEIDPEDGSITPRLATGWEQLDDDTWRFQLREGVKFHDGADFNAEAVKFNIERMLGDAIYCEDKAKFFAGTDLEVEVTDDHTIDVTATPPQPILPTLFGTIAIGSPNLPTDELTREPVGTGPYVFAEWRPDRDIVLERFEDYWGEPPAVEQATYVWREESAVRAAMVAAGEADISPTIAAQDATDPEMDFSYFNSETSRLRISMDVPPLDDVRVRKAVNHLIDREAMIGTIFPEGVVPAANLVVPSINGHNPDIEPYSYDPAKAKELLDAARADGVPVDEEIRLIGRLEVYPNATESMEAILAMLLEGGINASLEMVEVAQWTDLATKPYAEDRPPTLLQSMHDNNNGDAVFTVYYKYHSEGAQSDTDDPELDRKIIEAGAATGEERTKMFQEIFRIVHDDVVPQVLLYHMVGFSRVHPRLDFTPTLATNSELQLSQISFKE